MLFLFFLSLLRWEVAGVRTVDLAATCGKSKEPIDILLSPFEMSAVIFKFGSQSAPMPPAFVHKMPSVWTAFDDIDSSESQEDQSGYIFENHNGTMHLEGDAGVGHLHVNSSSQKRERRRRGLFSFSKSSAKSCHFHLNYEEQKLSGMHFGIEDISLDTERTCSEFIEISGTNVYYETTERKICGKDLTSTTIKVDTFEEVFIGNLTIKVSISKEGKSMFRFVVTGFNTGADCSTKSSFLCPTSSFRDEYESLKSEPLCIWGGFQCDSHLNCPFSAYDEKGHKCPKSSLLRQKQSNAMRSRHDEDMTNLSRLVLGISVFFVCVLCVISCQFLSAKRKQLNAEAQQNGLSTVVTVAVTESSRGMNAPPPSYSDVMCPPPAYDTVVGLESIAVGSSDPVSNKNEDTSETSNSSHVGDR